MHTRQTISNRRRAGAYTFLEALLLITILGIGGAAVGRALTAVTHSPEQNNNDLATETALLDKMEYLHSLSFSVLAADVNKYPSAYTDQVTIGQSPVTRTVSIVYIVPSTGAVSPSATHMLQVTVSTDTKSLSSLVNEP